MGWKYTPVKWKQFKSVELVTEEDKDYKDFRDSIKGRDLYKEKRDALLKVFCDKNPSIVKRIKKEYQNFLDGEQRLKRGHYRRFNNVMKYLNYRFLDDSELEILKPPTMKKDFARCNYSIENGIVLYNWRAYRRLFESLASYILKRDLSTWTKPKSMDLRKRRYNIIEQNARQYLEERADRVLPRILKFVYKNNSKRFFKYPDILVELNGVYILVECKICTSYINKRQLHDYSLLFLKTQFYKDNVKPLLSVFYVPRKNIGNDDRFRSIWDKFYNLNLTYLDRYKVYPNFLYVSEIQEDKKVVWT